MSSRIRFVSAVLAVAAAGIVASDAADSNAAGGTQAFLKIDSTEGQLQGESTDSRHRGWIEISSINMGEARPVSREGSGGATTGAGAGKATFHDITITKTIDRSSPTLQKAAAAGTHFRDAVIELVKAGSDGKPSTYYRVTMSDVFVSSDKINTNGPRPTESLTLNFTKIQYEYANKNADGSAGNYNQAPEGWDVKANVAM